MMESILEQKIIPVVSSIAQLSKFIKSELQCCYIMNFHVSIIKEVVTTLHKHNKLGFVHLDLIHGLSNDEYATEFLCQQIEVDGIISTKGKVIDVAKKNNKISIQRMFLIDSMSLEKGIFIAKEHEPSAIEILPAIAFSIIPYIKSQTGIPLIGGGLIQNEKDIKMAFEAGLDAITTSNLALARDMNKIIKENK